MNNCIICKKIISSDCELCEEHKDVLKSIGYYYDQDPEVRHKWDNIQDLIESKSHSVTDKESIVDEVLDFIYSIKP